MASIPRRQNATLADWMAQAKGKSSGFDYLRISLAIGIIGWHTVVTAYGAGVQAQALSGPWRALPAVIVPMFFALSGFLVASSLGRNSIPAFLGLRALRILPGLAIEICVSALVLGPLLTTMPLREYFADPRFGSYLLSMLGDMHYFLPGLFADNPFPHYVNAQLWTIPLELGCYVGLAIGTAIGLCRAPGTVVCTVLTLYAVWAADAVLNGREWAVGSTAPAHVLPLCFLAGVTLHALRERVVASVRLGLIALGLALLALDIPGCDYLIPFPVAYATVTLGLLNPRRWGLVAWGDYSYGVYIYGFPIEQVAASGGVFHSWFMVLVLSLPVILGLAMLSWHLIEKPALGLRHHLSKLDAVSRHLQLRRQSLAATELNRLP